MRYPANPQPQLSPNSKQFSQSKNIKHPKTIGEQEFHSLFQYLAVQVSNFLFTLCLTLKLHPIQFLINIKCGNNPLTMEVRHSAKCNSHKRARICMAITYGNKPWPFQKSKEPQQQDVDLLTLQNGCMVGQPTLIGDYARKTQQAFIEPHVPISRI